jgi:hypothetical protein
MSRSSRGRWRNLNSSISSAVDDEFLEMGVCAGLVCPLTGGYKLTRVVNAKV